jgi:hypothetical protein
MFGMAGGSAGQFVVGPMIGAGVPWSRSGSAWASPGWRSARAPLPASEGEPKTPRQQLAAPRRRGAIGLVFLNPQSILCGLIAGLLFIPTTIFDMVWGVRFCRRRAASTTDGGGALGDGAARLDHRLPAARLRLRPHRAAQAGDRRRGGVLLGCLAWILYGPAGCCPRTFSAWWPGSPRARRCCRTP